jgi:hypothetical protein
MNRAEAAVLNKRLGSMRRGEIPPDLPPLFYPRPGEPGYREGMNA